MSKDEPHIDLAKRRILSDLRYLEQWKADIIKAIVVADDIHDFKLEDMDKLGFKLL